MKEERHRQSDERANTPYDPERSARIRQKLTPPSYLFGSAWQIIARRFVTINIRIVAYRPPCCDFARRRPRACWLHCRSQKRAIPMRRRSSHATELRKSAKLNGVA